MLVISRVSGEKFRVMVGEVPVWITLLELDRGKARIGIDAPRDCAVHREELLPLEERHKRLTPVGNDAGHGHH